LALTPCEHGHPIVEKKRSREGKGKGIVGYLTEGKERKEKGQGNEMGGGKKEIDVPGPVVVAGSVGK
jgi:hypothetical protein